jgi:hypothetical protein
VPLTRGTTRSRYVCPPPPPSSKHSGSAVGKAGCWACYLLLSLTFTSPREAVVEHSPPHDFKGWARHECTAATSARSVRRRR